MTRKVQGTRARLLGSVYLGVMATTLATGAMAADTEVSLSAQTAIATASQMVGGLHLNIGAISATVDGALISNTTVSAPGSTSGAFSVTSNLVSASGVGNTAVDSIDLALIENDEEDGAAAASLSVNTNLVTSAVTNSTIAVDLNGFASGSVSNTGNTIAATTQGNTGSTLLAGEIPNGYASAAPGSTSLTYPSGTESLASGSLVATSAQANTASGHRADVSGNEITLDLTSATSNTVTAGPTLDDNTISATLRGNTNQMTIDLDGGENPAFQGSAVVTNLQLNTGIGSFNVASNTNSAITAEVSGDNLLAVNTLNGGLSVSGNAITSRIVGNSALDNAGSPVGNQILIGDTLSILGTQATGGSSIQLDEGDIAAVASATLTIMNTQGNTGGLGLVAETHSATIGAGVDSLVDGTINTVSNEIGARASGNASTSAIRSEGTGTTFDASAAIANNQTNLGTTIVASAGLGFPGNISIGAGSGTDGGVTTGSRISVSNNAATATAFGNETGQTLALNATNLTLDPGVATLSGSNSPDGNVAASGAATVASLQANYNTDVAAVLSGSTIWLEANSQGGIGASILEDNSLEVTGNAQDVLAAGNSGSNTLSLQGNTVGGASGLASVQVGENSDVTAELNTVVARINALTDVVGGTIDLSGNTMQARAFGGSVANTVSVSGTSADLDSVADAGSNPGLGTVISNYGLLNRQVGDGTNVSSTADASEGGFQVGVSGLLLDAGIVNDANRLVGLAFGNQATNTTSINVGTITTDDTAGNAQVANALNMQNVTGDVAARATGGSVMNTYVQGSAIGSGISTSDNLIRAQATGNLAATITTVDATTLTTSQIAYAGGTIETDAAFTVENRQASTGSVRASQLDDASPATQSASIRTTIDGFFGLGIIGSTVVSDNNTSETRATANDAANLLSLSANSAATSSAVKNIQSSFGVVTAQMGIAGTPPVAPANYPVGGVGGTGDIITVTGTLVTIGAGDSLDIVFDQTGAGGAILADLLDAMGATVVGGTATFGAGSYDFVGFDSFTGGYTVGVGSSVSFSGFSTGGTPGVSPAGGVTIAASGMMVQGSTLSVAGNVSRGSVTGNSATNALSVEATAITGDLGGSFLEGAATHVVANQQGNNAELASSVTAAFEVDTAVGALISGSSISVSDNAQMATAVGNTAQSTLSLGGAGGAEAASVAASSELSSVQGSFEFVTATSTMQASAAAAINGSSLVIDGNRNTALAVANDATNASNVRATNAATTSSVDANAFLTGALFSSTADHLVYNRQSGDSPITATAQSNIFNQDLLVDGTTGISVSSISMSGNTTIAEASTNRATNSLTLDAGADLGATGGVMNSQSSFSAVTASATSDVTVGLTGHGGFATVNGSSLAIEGNATTALARGNFAGNVLNASAGAGYAAQVENGASDVTFMNQTVAANYAVLNTQQNYGAINASSSGTTYRASPAGATVSDTMATGSSLHVGGNLVASEAFGNQASNTLQLAGLNTTMPTSAIGSYQQNTASVTSSVMGASVGIAGTGSAQSSGLGVSGNTISAASTGNSVTNRINGN